MKRTSFVTWAIALVVIGISFCAEAASPTAPHSSPISCTTCHVINPLGPASLGAASQSSPAYYNNVCQSCHRPGDASAGSKPLSSGDASVIFGGHTTNSGISRLQTSHRWDGSDINPAAGALPPIQAAMTSGSLQGANGKANLRGRSGNQLACVRCHSVHLATPNTHFTRMANDQDQMCMDCHRSRDTSNVTLNPDPRKSGSHPVNVNYAAAVAKGNFNNNPFNANPANPTSDLGAKFTATGNVVCSTCHGVHYTDSRSTTFDGASSAKGRNNYANLSSGDGYILRTDRRGAKVSSSDTVNNADKLNICTNCHANKKSHNAMDQDVQCNDCHGAHVDYDKDDPNNTKGKNVNLIRRDVTKDGIPGKVYFRYTGSQKEYKNPQGTGVCQGCHDVPASGGKYPPEHDSNKASDCNTCHYHSSQLGSFSGACGKCHGYPPTLATIGGPNGLATPATGALGGAAGAHDKHVNIQKMNCNVCHNRYANKTMPSTSIDLEFNINAGTYPGFRGISLNGNYNTPAPANGYSFTGPVNINAGANRTCATVYCHGGTLAPGTNSQPSWTDNASTATVCGACHSINLSSLYASHPSHAGVALTCNACHPAIAGTSHMNGSVQWDLSAIGASAQYKPAGGTASSSGETGNLAPSAAYGTCINVYCHGQGAPTWGATAAAPVNGFPYSSAQCGKCHSQAGDATFYSTATPKVTANTDAKVGAHTAHLKVTTDTISATITCSDCHTSVTTINSAGHMNGTTNFSWGALATNSGATSPTYSNGTCSNVYCHGVTLTGGTAAGTSPKWNVPFLPATISTAGCGTCHGFPPTGNNHPIFVAPTTFPAAAGSCSCHPNVNPSGTSYATIFVDKSKHINGLIEVSGCNGCHGYPPSKKGFVGSAGNYEFAKTENYSSGGGAHTVAGHVSPTANPSDGFANCSQCHNANDHAMSPYVFKPSSNIKIGITPKIRFANAVYPKYSSNKQDDSLHVSGTCSSIACHFQKSPKW